MCNFFYAVKLGECLKAAILSTKVGSKYYKEYDQPKTSYQRFMRSKHISQETKQKLTQTFKSLNPFELKKSIERKLKAIFDTNKVKPIRIPLGSPIPEGCFP